MSGQARPAVLVTGGAGYIGSHTAKALKQAGFLPVTLDNLSRGHRDAAAFGPFVGADAGDEASVRSAIREWDAQAVLHFAAFAYVDESVRNPGLYFRNNVAEMERLLSAATAEGIGKFVFSSSCTVYGLPDRAPVDEEFPLRALSPYGETKLIGERMLHWFGGATGLKHVALRYFNASGADPEGELGERHEPETHLIPNVIRAALGTGPALKVFGTDYATPDGTAIRDYVHVSDLADAHVKAVQYLLDGGESIAANLGSEIGHSVLSVIGEVARLTGRDVPHTLEPRRPGDAESLFASAARAKSVLGWTPSRSDLTTICRTAVDWEMRQR